MTAGKQNAYVCLSPLFIENFQLKEPLVIVTDILRATSCWVTALANGAESIHPVSTLDECRTLMEEGYFGAAERQGKQVEGFDAGNSPFDFSRDKVNGRRIAATTTNGSKTMKQLMTAREVVIGSMLNFSALAGYVKKSNTQILIVCSGWEGGISLEDMIFAGALLERLEPGFDPADDAAVVCLELWKKAQPGPKGWLKRSSHVQRLLNLGLEKDIDYCFSFDLFDIVPKVSGNEIIIPANLK